MKKRYSTSKRKKRLSTIDEIYIVFMITLYALLAVSIYMHIKTRENSLDSNKVNTIEINSSIKNE